MRKYILDIPIDWISGNKLIEKLETFVADSKPHQIATINPEFIVLSAQNRQFKQSLIQSDLALPDGTGIVIAQTYLDQKSKKSYFGRLVRYIAIGLLHVVVPNGFKYQRVQGVKLVEQLAQHAATRQWRIFLLGAKPGVAKKVAEIWATQIPQINIVGTSSADSNNPQIVNVIREKKPDILFVAYGAPKQELFIFENKGELNVPIMIGVGGTFDTIAGNKYNPPQWLKHIGLEWLVYLIRYPNRFSRIWRSTIKFSQLIIGVDSQIK